MIAYKFLAAGAVGPFTGFRWPRPGEGPTRWVTAPHGASDERWIHACRVEDLPYWLGAELWRLELDAPIVAAPHQIAAPRARLLEQVMGWNRALAAELAVDCALRARDLAVDRVPREARDALLSANDAATLHSVSDDLLRSEAAEAAAYVSTAALSAAQGGAAVAAFVVETFARSFGGEAAGERERLRQARWLAERLALPS